MEITLQREKIPFPHGGRLVNCNIPKKYETELPVIDISNDLRNDLENIADGIYSPLEGFIHENDFNNIISKGRLGNDLAWTIPIVLDTDRDTSKSILDSKDVLLSADNDPFAILHAEEAYSYNKKVTANLIYQTNDETHPGVARIYRMQPILIGGKIQVFSKLEKRDLRRFRLTPEESRKEISKRGWKTMVGFQTRNVPHIAHETLQKSALAIFDGLFINPLIGKKKKGDFKDEVIIESYLSLIDNYYQANHTLFSTLHTEMRYAGPKEAIHHAIMRKNFGCSHFIIGRDHAGVGNYYPPFAAQEIFKNYLDLEIEPVFFPAFYYCKKCLWYTNNKSCPHDAHYKEELSGTKMRKMVSSGEIPMPHLMRPEIAQIILSHKEPFVN